MEAVNQGHTREDQDSPHDQSAQNPPKQDLVLILGWNPEVRKDEQEDKDIINTQGLFDQVTGKILQRSFRASEEVNADIK